MQSKYQNNQIEVGNLDSVIGSQEVKKAYIPLGHYLSERYTAHAQTSSAPYLIGVSGSVASGKTTTAHLLHRILQLIFPHKKIELVSTDGFLMTTAALEAQDLMKRKGFPESFDWPKMLGFIKQVKDADWPALAPIYSHESYDILPDTFVTINDADIVIFEGINVLQTPDCYPHDYVTNYLDFSIYVDTEEKHIKDWYTNRLISLKEKHCQDPNSRFYKFKDSSKEEVIDFASKIWDSINSPNLQGYIQPSMQNAHCILHKNSHHTLSHIKLMD